MTEAAQAAEEHDVNLAFEPEVKNVVKSAEKARRIIDDVVFTTLKFSWTRLIFSRRASSRSWMRNWMGHSSWWPTILRWLTLRTLITTAKQAISPLAEAGSITPATFPFCSKAATRVR